MSVICWNRKGFRSASKVRDLKDMIKAHQPRIMCLIKTKRFVRCWDVLRVNLDFSNYFAVDMVGFLGSLAILWHPDVNLSITNFSRYHVHMEVDMDPFIWKPCGE